MLATIPVGLVGVTLEHTFRTVLAKPVAASAFLFINGLILLAGEGARRRAERRLLSARPPRGEARPPPLVEAAGPPEGSPEFVASGARTVEELAAAYASDVRIARIGYRDSIYVGSFQINALLAGISRSGVAMVGGLWRGLSHEDAARFAFLLATPVILAAGVLKLPSLVGHAGAHIHGQIVVGFVITSPPICRWAFSCATSRPER